MPVITVSGTLGSGAREIARALADKLGLEYVDHDILVEAARLLGVSVEDVEHHDERPSTIGERLSGVMRTLMERSAVAGATDPMTGGGLEMVLARTYGEAAELPETGALTDDRYIKTLTSVIREIAARGDVVILGRGSQVILQEEPETLHVWVASTKDLRVRNLVEREGMAPEDAEKRIKESDQNRQAFHRRYFKVDADNARLYDLVINMRRIPTPTAVRLIALAVQEKSPLPG